ncbi:hypothetical protein CHARACLAT_010355 [Characodon lateralis]|uniref:Uncharacterized protein n=1 Tax=Characodon lateralis TaxID=208331 RepID=A0ABU7DRV6_9TELE|nr:hypothetical protein [Characodon lateralis]
MFLTCQTNPVVLCNKKNSHVFQPIRKVKPINVFPGTTKFSLEQELQRQTGTSLQPRSTEKTSCFYQMNCQKISTGVRSFRNNNGAFQLETLGWAPHVRGCY